MARFIEIQDGISLNVADIEGIKKISDSSCEIYTHHRKYLCTYPYETILAMLKEGEVINREMSDSQKFQSAMEKLDTVLNKAQYISL